MFAAPLQHGARAVLLFNRQPTGDGLLAVLDWHRVGYPDHLKVHVRDLFAHKDIGTFSDKLHVNVSADSSVMVKLQPADSAGCDRSPRATVAQAASSVIETGTDNQHEQQKRRLQAIQDAQAGTAVLTSDARSAALHGVCDNELVAKLDAWRPWDHGFFGPVPKSSWQ